MYPQELIDEILDNLHDSSSALKACSLVSHQFYPRTRDYLFRCVDCPHPDEARIFDIARDSPELLRCIKRVQFRCLDFFLPQYQTATCEILHSLPSPMTLSFWADRVEVSHSTEECEWPQILPALMSSAPYLAVTRLELKGPQWCTFLEFHHIILSFPNLTELYILGMRHLIVYGGSVIMPASPAPRIKKMCMGGCISIPAFWEGLRSYRSVYLDHLEEFYAINFSPDEFCAIVQAANIVSNGLKVVEITCSCIPIWNFPGLSPNVSPLHLNATADLRLGGHLNDRMLPFINWWIKCFQAFEKESTIMERLTIKLGDWGSPVPPGQLEPLKRAFEELSDLLSRLVRNVDLVFQLKDYYAHPDLSVDCLRGAIVDACKVLKKTNSRAFDMTERTPDVPVFPFPASTRIF
ncbi:uncharacterized protein EV420DRAFT_1490261 [Desarmillaria tabescens]|uniref:F-box domain-containing protein n=1 Tax=Armillaria tabescens TaxID=1929756 RepID=A0AA39IX12_ARMTA|nr:uncharacterized protein EV420DRAFT_1490261 [Desarmillaria tabescens]KAK0432052.1 hypothetical protein EV420DRAFT_1490261 [Desarmillaria tabescens]